MQQRLHAPLRKPRGQFVTPGVPGDEEVPGRLGPRRRDRQAKAGDVGEHRHVGRRDRAPAAGPGVEVAQLDREHRGLKLVEPRVDARFLVMVLARRAVIGPPADRVGPVGPVRHHAAAIAERAEILAGIEAERRDVAQRADLAAVQRRAVGLGGILDHRNAPRCQNIADVAEIDRQAVERDNQHGARPRRQRAQDAGRVDQHRRRIGVDGHGSRAGVEDGEPGGDEGMR